MVATPEMESANYSCDLGDLKYFSYDFCRQVQIYVVCIDDFTPEKYVVG